MGCGCKNKSQGTTIDPNSKVAQTIKQNNETIKESIKKTVEKYYYTDKKTNGWVKG
jgi:hypothetical protein